MELNTKKQKKPYFRGFSQAKKRENKNHRKIIEKVYGICYVPLCPEIPSVSSMWDSPN